MQVVVIIYNCLKIRQISMTDQYEPHVFVVITKLVHLERLGSTLSLEQSRGIFAHFEFYIVMRRRRKLKEFL